MFLDSEQIAIGDNLTQRTKLHSQTASSICKYLAAQLVGQIMAKNGISLYLIRFFFVHVSTSLRYNAATN